MSGAPGSPVRLAAALLRPPDLVQDLVRRRLALADDVGARAGRRLSAGRPASLLRSRLPVRLRPLLLLDLAGPAPFSETVLLLLPLFHQAVGAPPIRFLITAE